MKKQILFSIFLLLLAVACGREGEKAAPASVEALKNHIKYLASEELRGRGTGMPENREAAAYVAKQYEAAGLQAFDGQYLQEFTVTTGVSFGANTSLTLFSGDVEHTLKAGEDFTPLSQSRVGNIDGELVFVGYGIIAEDKNYDDYSAVDVDGKIAVILRETPDGDNPHGDFANYARDIEKIRVAREKGAIAAVLINAAHQDDGLVPLRVTYPQQHDKIAVLSITRKAIAPLFPENRSLRDIETAISDQKKSFSFVLKNARLSGLVELSFKQATTANVIGYVRGSDPAMAEEYVVVGAHYDHLGMGGHGSRSEDDQPAIHYGADDNASGTAGIIEIARLTAKNPLPRPVVFMAFGAEELGLLGATYFCDNPVLPLEKIVAMVNLDMIGRMTDNKVTISGTGTAAGFDALVDTVAAEAGLNISKSADGFGPSDHSAFYGRDIPVLAFFSGLHDDYHRPTDTWDKINYEGTRTITLAVKTILDSIAMAPQSPEFVKVESSGNSGRQMRFRVWVGTIPDYSDNPLGMRITGVRDSSPAANGGMTGGDIIVKFGADSIKNIYDYTYALGKYKPGDEVPVTVLRGENNEPHDLMLVLQGRK